MSTTFCPTCATRQTDPIPMQCKCGTPSDFFKTVDDAELASRKARAASEAETLRTIAAANQRTAAKFAPAALAERLNDQQQQLEELKRRVEVLEHLNSVL